VPGLDGITYEFYKKFWNERGPLLLRIANTSMQEEKLPSSMLNGVITLVPPRGDPSFLSNWRPMALQNATYKLTRCLASRMTSLLPVLIITDQSYCVPNRNIHTNFQLIGDSTDYANQKDAPLAIISLDQSSAYDCMEPPLCLSLPAKIWLRYYLYKKYQNCVPQCARDSKD
jgi:hypothetical protein